MFCRSVRSGKLDHTQSSIGENAQGPVLLVSAQGLGLGKTPDAVAAHLSNRSVCVHKKHFEIYVVIVLSIETYEKPVCAYTAMAVAPTARPFNPGFAVRHLVGIVAQVNKEIVSEAVVFGEAKCHRQQSRRRDVF